MEVLKKTEILIFDLDGVLFDTNKKIGKIVEILFKKRGKYHLIPGNRYVGRNPWTAWGGIKGVNTIEKLKEIDEEEAAKHIFSYLHTLTTKEKRKIVFLWNKIKAKPFPCVYEMLSNLQKRYKIIFLSHSPKKAFDNLKFLPHNLFITPKFNGKFEKTKILQELKKLGKAVFLTDTTMDAEDALLADVPVMGVATGFSPKKWLKEMGIPVIDAIKEIE